MTVGRALVGAFIAATLVPVVAAEVPIPAPVATAQIIIKSFAFWPKRLTVKHGTTVTWVNRDDEIHTVTSAGKLLHSPALDTDESFTFRFEQTGVYDYFCKLHSRMTGTVVVE
jgi:plastocyanin